MFDGMNQEDSLEVLKLRELCMNLNHKQLFSLIKSLTWDMRRLIDYMALEEEDKSKWLQDKFDISPESWEETFNKMNNNEAD